MKRASLCAVALFWVALLGGSPAWAQVTWDFETGDLRGWERTGTAFDTQPTYGDNPTARHRGQPSRHQGNYWIGGYENRMTPADPPGRVQGDGPVGTLTSPPFVIRASAISFLIGGGCDVNAVRAELLVEGQVVRRATGKCTETMHRERWEVSAYAGRTAQVRLVDASGGGWGHINFDDVRFEGAVAAPPPSPAAVELTGIWRGNDGGVYYLRQVGNRLFWVGESGDAGESWTNVAAGTIAGNRVALEWADVVKGRARSSGLLWLRVESADRLVRTDATGGFGGSEWRRAAAP